LPFNVSESDFSGGFRAAQHAAAAAVVEQRIDGFLHMRFSLRDECGAPSAR